MFKIYKIFHDALLRRFDWYFRIPCSHRQFKHIHIINSISSIQYIIKNKCSVSRFGDGEIIMMFNEGYDGYQRADRLLAMRLRQVLLSNDVSNHMIALPMPLKSTIKLRKTSKEFWGYFTLRKGGMLRDLLSTQRIYLDTQLSRFYMMYDDKTQCRRQICLLKQIWNKRDIVIVEGSQSRTGIGNDLYNNANSIQRIIGYATDAFSHYGKMLETIKKNVTIDKLILLSYGPTATILAYDLAKLGYQAIDLGHLDIEYEWYKLRAIDNVPIKGKFTNEAKEGRIVDNCEDLIYQGQIICDISKSNS